jgi:hypothetical protein
LEKNSIFLLTFLFLSSFFFETGSCYVAHVILQLAPPASASLVLGL